MGGNIENKTHLSFQELSVKNMRKKRKLQKLRNFELEAEEKRILQSSHDDLRTNIVEQIESKIEENLNKIDELNKLKESANTEDEKNKLKKQKKEIVEKLQKNKKSLTDQKEIKYRLSLMKQRQRKLKAVESSVSENLEKLKKMNVKCFKCRRSGHTVDECTFDDRVAENNDNDDDAEKNKENEQNSTEKLKENTTKKLDSKKNKPLSKVNSQPQKIICYNCGSDTHNVHGCDKPVDYGNLPFSSCFICGEMGHLSSRCPKSDKGIYIKGCLALNAGVKNILQKIVQLSN